MLTVLDMKRRCGVPITKLLVLQTVLHDLSLFKTVTSVSMDKKLKCLYVHSQQQHLAHSEEHDVVIVLERSLTMHVPASSSLVIS